MSVALLIRPTLIDCRYRAAIESAHRILRGCARGSKPGKQPRVEPGARAENCDGSWDIDKRNAPHNFLLEREGCGSASRRQCRDRGTRRAILRHAVRFGAAPRAVAQADERFHGATFDQSRRLRARRVVDLARSIFRENVHALRRFAAADSIRLERNPRAELHRERTRSRAPSFQERHLDRRGDEWSIFRTRIRVA